MNEHFFRESMMHRAALLPLLFLLAAAPASQPAGDAAPSTYPALQKKLAQLASQVAELTAANKKLTDENSNLVAQVKSLQPPAVKPALAAGQPDPDHVDKIPKTLPLPPVGKPGGWQLAELRVYYMVIGDDVDVCVMCDELGITVYADNMKSGPAGLEAASKKVDSVLPGDGPMQNRMALAGWELISTERKDTGDRSFRSWEDHFHFKRPVRTS